MSTLFYVNILWIAVCIDYWKLQSTFWVHTYIVHIPDNVKVLENKQSSLVSCFINAWLIRFPIHTVCSLLYILSLHFNYLWHNIKCMSVTLSCLFFHYLFKAYQIRSTYRLLFLRLIAQFLKQKLFCQFISWTKWVNSGKFMDNCWI